MKLTGKKWKYFFRQHKETLAEQQQGYIKRSLKIQYAIKNYKNIHNVVIFHLTLKTTVQPKMHIAESAQEKDIGQKGVQLSDLKVKQWVRKDQSIFLSYVFSYY